MPSIWRHGLAAVWRGEAPEAELDRFDKQRRLVTLETIQKTTIQNKKNLESPGDEFRNSLQAIAADPARTRDYLMRVSMIASSAAGRGIGVDCSATTGEHTMAENASAVRGQRQAVRRQDRLRRQRQWPSARRSTCQPDWKGIYADTIGRRSSAAGKDYVMLMADMFGKGYRRRAPRRRQARRRVGLYRPVHAKTLRSQKLRTLLTHRKLLQSKAIAIDNDLRGTLRNFGLKLALVGTARFEARIRELVENLPDLAALVEPLLIVRRTLREQFCILHRRLPAIVRDDECAGAR